MTNPTCARRSTSDAAEQRANVVFTYADESQSGFRMFNELDDDTVDVAVNWATLSNAGGKADAVQVRLQLRGS